MTRTALHDIAVVGGGPAGATAAFLLARRGFAVTLFDRHRFPRPKLCAGLLTLKTIRLLKSLFGLGPEDLSQSGIIVRTCRDYRVYFKQRELARGRLEFPFHLTDRARYDLFWLQMAEGAGARLHLGIPVMQCEPDGALHTADGRAYHFDAVIGADGVLSAVRRAVFNAPQQRLHWRANLAGTIEVTPLAQARNSFAALYFGYVPWGYAWSFPNPQGAVVGICGLHDKSDGVILKEAFGQLLADRHWGGPATHWDSHPLPYGNFLRNPGQDRILLAGDACGLADPLLGEGIYYAHRSAQAAAEAVLACRRQPSDLAAFYRQTLHSVIVREFLWIGFYRRLIFSGGRRRRLRGLQLFLKVFPRRLEALVQGTRPFSRLLLP